MVRINHNIFAQIPLASHPPVGLSASIQQASLNRNILVVLGEVTSKSKRPSTFPVTDWPSAGRYRGTARHNAWPTFPYCASSTIREVTLDAELKPRSGRSRTIGHRAGWNGISAVGHGSIFAERHSFQGERLVNRLRWIMGAQRGKTARQRARNGHFGKVS